MVYARGSLHFVQSLDFGGYGTIYIDIQLVAEVNDAKKLVRKVPTLKQVEDWVEQAGKLPRVLNY